MVAMGGGEDFPSRGASKEKEIVLCTLPWPKESANKGIEELKKEFKDVEVHYYHTKSEHGKVQPIDVPEGMSLFLYYHDSQAIITGVTIY